MAKKAEIEQTEIESPYELPDGWKWERASNFADIFTGNSINENVKKEKYTGITEGLNFIGTKDVDFDGTINYENGVKISDYENFKTVPSNTPLLCIEGGSAGKKLGITSEQVCFGNKLCAFVCKNVESKLVYYYLQTNAFFYSFMKERHGLIGGVTVGTLKNIPFPLPPTVAEQQRIVNRIETMFEKLDQAQEKAQSVLGSFETRKAAILHKAFTGELTANWRKENGVADESWEEKRFDEVADIKSNLVDVAEYQDFPHIAPDNIEKKTGVLLEYHTVAEDKVKSGKHRFYAGQILYSKIRPYLSKVVVVDFDGVCSADMYPIEAKGDTRFLWYQMLSNEFLDRASNSGSRSVLPKINQKELSVIPMRTCSLPEQQEIVRILDTILKKETRAKEAAQTVLEQIALLKKSILARAFRGEL